MKTIKSTCLTFILLMTQHYYVSANTNTFKITVQPEGGTICLNSDHKLSIETEGTVYRVQWYFNGEIIPEAYQNEYTITNAQYANAGKYRVDVYGNEVISSDEIEIKVESPASITKDISDFSICEEETINLSVDVTGDNLNYQWFFNDKIISGANTPSLKIYNITPEDNYGYYQLKINNGCTSEVLSHKARIWVARKLGSNLPPVEAPAVAYVGERIRLHVGNDYGYTDVNNYTWAFSAPNEDLGIGLPNHHTVYINFTKPSENQLIIVTMQHVCKSYVAFALVKVKYPTDIKNTPENISEIYPNPVKNELYINSESKINRIDILDSNGRILDQIQTNENNLIISTAKFKPGIYFIKMDTEEGINFHKIIKQE